MRTLEAGVAVIRDLFAYRGFLCTVGETGRASSGHFANCFFRYAEIEIGLIVRNNTKFGCPNYTTGNGFAGHDDMMWAVGSAGRERLVPKRRPRGRLGAIEFVAKDGGDPFVALRSDLETILFPVFDRSPDDFRALIASAVARR